MNFAQLPAGQVESALDADNLDALFASFIDDDYVSNPTNLPADQDLDDLFDDVEDNCEGLFEIDSAGQNPEIHRPSTGGKTVESLIAAGLYVEPDDEGSSIAPTEYSDCANSDDDVDQDDASSNCTTEVSISSDEQDSSEDDGEKPTGNPNVKAHITPGVEAFSPEMLPFMYLDEEEQQSLIVNYINDHQDWFRQEIGDRQNLQQIVQQFPLEIGAFLSKKKNKDVLNVIRDKYPRLFSGSGNAPDNNEEVDDNQAALSRFLSNHANHNTLSTIFTDHPKILAHSLKSLDDSSVLFAFLSKHKHIVGKFLEQHKNISVLADFLHNHPTAMDHILDEEPSIIENFLSANPHALYVFLDAKSHVLHDYLIAKPEKLEKYLQVNPKFLESFLDKHPDLVANYVHKQLVPNTAISDVQSHDILGGNTNDISVPEEVRNIITYPVDSLQNTQTPSNQKPPITDHDLDEQPRSSLSGKRQSLATDDQAIQSPQHNDFQEHAKNDDNRHVSQPLDVVDSAPEEDVTEPKPKQRSSRLQDRGGKQAISATGERSARARVGRGTKQNYKEFFDGNHDESDSAGGVEQARNKGRRRSDGYAARKFKHAESDYDSDNDDKTSSLRAIQKKPRTARSLPSITPTKRNHDAEVNAVLPARAAVPYPAPAELLAKDRLKPLGGHAWTLREEDCGIKHMFDIDMAKQIKGEDRFAEAVRRMNAELGVNRTKFSFKNFWNRAGRARSRLDERRCKSTTLATSLQGRAHENAVVGTRTATETVAGAAEPHINPFVAPTTMIATPEATPPNDHGRVTPERPSNSPITSPETTSDTAAAAAATAAHKRKSEEPEEEDFELDSNALAFALGTREKKKVRYTY